MTGFQEKIFFGSTTLLSSGFSTLGAIMTAGETRWVYVTFAASSMTAGFVSLMFKKSDETMRLVLGRFGFSILGGILATKPLVQHLGLAKLCEEDLISLGGLSALCCILTFFIGFYLLGGLEKLAPEIAAKWLKKLDPP